MSLISEETCVTSDKEIYVDYKFIILHWSLNDRKLYKNRCVQSPSFTVPLKKKKKNLTERRFCIFSYE